MTTVKQCFYMNRYLVWQMDAIPCATIIETSARRVWFPSYRLDAPDRDIVRGMKTIPHSYAI